MKDKEVDFIARHYIRGKFSVDSAWRRLGIAPSFRLRRFRVAAAAAVAVILSATAAIIYREYRMDDAVRQTAPAITASPLAEVRVIDFENAPLPDVIREIESVYAVKVEDIPETPESYTLSLHYEGTPADLISVINDILETHMTVTER